ncbi:MAG TPA: hypothetical protein VJ140_05730, partial [Actinomycetota bacterium]|nr:hypothetical protein [Actinomycetota bacterium]
FVFRGSASGAGPHAIKVAYNGDFRQSPTQQVLDVEVAKGDQGLQLTGPADVSAGAAFHLSGHINYFATRSTAATVTGPDGAVTQVPISMDGTMNFGLDVRAPDTAAQGAQWTVTIPGDANHEADSATFTTNVKGPHSVAFTPGTEPYVIGQEASLRIQVPGTSSPSASIRVSDPLGRTVWTWTGTIPEEGLDYRSTLPTAQQVDVSVAADAGHLFTQASYAIRPKLSMTTRLAGTYAQVGKYAVYDSSQEPRVVTRPEPYPGCVRHVFQELTPRGWETTRAWCASRRKPRFVTRVDWRHEAGERYRVSHLFKADQWYLRTEGEWHYFRFT